MIIKFCLVFISGLAIMFLLVYYQIVPVPELRHNVTETIIVLICVAMVVVGWTKIILRHEGEG